MNCGGCGRYMAERTEEKGGGNILCARCWFRQEEAMGLSGWRKLSAWTGWLVTSLVCLSLVILYYQGTGKGPWALLLLGVLTVALFLPVAAWWMGKRNWKLLGACFICPLGGWFMLWDAAPGVGWSGSFFVIIAGAFLLLLGAVMFSLFIREMVKLPRR